MQAMPPTIVERDQCLDELATAYALGRLSDAEFARRSDIVFTSDDRDELHGVMADVRRLPPRQAPRPVAPTQAHPYQPVHPDVRTNQTRRDLLIGAGVVSFVALAGVGLLIGGIRSSDSEPPVDAMPPAPPMDFLHDTTPARLLTDGCTLGSVKITANQISALRKPLGQSWEVATMDGAYNTTAVPSDGPAVIFDNADVDLGILVSYFPRAQEALATDKPVTGITLKRPTANGEVHALIYINGVGGATFEAISGTLLGTERDS